MNQLSAPAQYIDTVADYFDSLTPQATDDELFAAGYLRGHFDLAVGSLEVAAEPFDKTQLCNWVGQSLAKAIAGGELNADDQRHVQQLWQQVQML
ncbi:YfcL family protein [Arsukibacterium indicum]|uniref:YfcL family protein n=1 Tax=Arsukibacterium indicum TaxID=2848612 RepID=A0ABS6MFR2_9GAMM|nr:YfcL family protein [Arsukibacterium indicum]MBV2127653.1 YfcL family protein [Arsukibacterium indicum]